MSGNQQIIDAQFTEEQAVLKYRNAIQAMIDFARKSQTDTCICSHCQSFRKVIEIGNKALEEGNG